jgi:cobalamin biosynthesis Mg chelatase CobN
MPLYVVVHHRRDENQPWVNAWLDDQLIEAIQTTKEIGKLCRQAKERGERVFVHRCGWLENSPVICCSAEVDGVDHIDKTTSLVRFNAPQALNQLPPSTPIQGQNFYSRAD